MKTYEAWVMINSENDVITEEHSTPQEAIQEMVEKGYKIEELKEAKCTCNRVLCDGKSWLECLEEYEY